MAFKLVRTDSAEPLKIQLPVGHHIIGRGSFLNVDNINDKRVSRNHAELVVTSDTVTIKSLHLNPCFYIKKNTDETQLLIQSHSVTLGNGDKFGILPQTYWYEVIHCTLDDACGIPQNNVDNNSETTEIDERVDNADLTDCDISDELERPTSPSAIGSNVPQEANGDQSQSLISEKSSPPTAKRCASDEDNEGASKKLKTEPLNNVRQEVVDTVVKNESADDQAGPSNDQRGASNNSKGNVQNKPATLAQPAAPRERCIYGANCYRRNPQHKVEFSHPNDSDWGTGARGVCPYGINCRKREPRHWQHHEHPPGVQPPPNAPLPGKKKNRAVKRKTSTSDSEDDLDANIVTGKRARKTLVTAKWSGSESGNEDPFGTDESDEWQPSTDYTETQDY